MQVNIKYLALLYGGGNLLHGKTICQTLLFPCTPLHHMWGLEESLRTSATDFKTPNNSTAGVPSLMISAQTHVTTPDSGPQPRQSAETLKGWKHSFILNSICISQKNQRRKQVEMLTLQAVQQSPFPQDFPMVLSLNSSLAEHSLFHKMQLHKKVTAGLSDPGLET